MPTRNWMLVDKPGLDYDYESQFLKLARSRVKAARWATTKTDQGMPHANGKHHYSYYSTKPSHFVVTCQVAICFL